MVNHIAQIAAKLPEYGLDAMLITSESGERYALGFHGEGLLLVTRNGAHYTTDGRYIEAAREQITGARVELVTAGNGHLEQARAYIQREDLHNVGFESGSMSVDDHRRYSEKLPCILTAAQNLLDGLRASKDEEELAHMRRAQEVAVPPGLSRVALKGDAQLFRKPLGPAGPAAVGQEKQLDALGLQRLFPGHHPGGGLLHPIGGQGVVQIGQHQADAPLRQGPGPDIGHRGVHPPGDRGTGHARPLLSGSDPPPRGIQ